LFVSSGINANELRSVEDDVLPEEVNTGSLIELEKIKIYFGHQSVGLNIIDGIKDVIAQSDRAKLNIYDVGEFNKDYQSGLFHSKIGNNRDPESKINEFIKVINELNGQIDFGALKFCYVDFDKNTDIKALFNKYENAINKLSEYYPDIRFIHVTVPLKTIDEITWKVKIKQLLGFEKIRELGEYYNNIKRNEYNDLMRKKYSQVGLLFDLAEIESTHMDGKRAVYFIDGKQYYALVPEYTDDGGHLNSTGRSIVADKFLLFISTSK